MKKFFTLRPCVVFGAVWSVLVFFSLTVLFAETPKRHRFSMTCKVDSIIDLFPNSAEREKAIHWMTDMGVEKIWLEIFRHGREADTELLRSVRDDFRAAGFEVAGCITPTTAEFRPLLACAGRPEDHELFARLSAKGASLFDLVILDDFVFTGCECEACSAAKGERSWSDFRRDFELELGRTFILEPARRVNPNIEIIMKFPCWYDGYCGGGYDVVRESELYDGVWIGTETREPESPYAGRLPQTQASWISGWMNDVAGEKCRGVWFDPIDTGPETYVEQARQSILGGARETLLHCYDYLGTDSPGIVLHGTDRDMARGRLDADAFRRERDGLTRLADAVQNRVSLGVAVPKNPDRDAEEDQLFAGFVGMVGIPFVPSGKTPGEDAVGLVLSRQAELIPGQEEATLAMIDAGKPILVTANLAKRWPESLRTRLGIPDHVRTDDPTQAVLRPLARGSFLLDVGDDPWNLMNLPQTELNSLRTPFLAPFGVRLSAPSRVSIHLFAPDKTSACDLIALENFNREEVTLRLTCPNTGTEKTWKRSLALPTEDVADITSESDGGFRIRMAPRSLILLVNQDNGVPSAAESSTKTP